MMSVCCASVGCAGEKGRTEWQRLCKLGRELGPGHSPFNWGGVGAAGKALWFFFAIYPFLSLSKGVSGAMPSQLAYWACDPEANGQPDHFHLLAPEMRNTDSFPRQVTETQTGNHQELLGKKPIAAVQMSTLGGAIVGKPSLPLLEVSAGFSHLEVHPLRKKKAIFL